MQRVLEYEAEVQHPRLRVLIVLAHLEQVCATDQVLEATDTHFGHVLADLVKICYYLVVRIKSTILRDLIIIFVSRKYYYIQY